jgi:glycosyltransferase involved in cell wall biosynthesis
MKDTRRIGIADNILFITWDGPDSNYLENLFGPIFYELKSENLNFSIAQFTWKNRIQLITTKQRCSELELSYQNLPVFRRLKVVGSAISILLNTPRLIRKICREKINITIIRSIFPATTLLILPKFLTPRLIYDSDGVIADEMVDFSNLSSHSLLYKALRLVEKIAIDRSDIVLCRSRYGCDLLYARSNRKKDINQFLVVKNGRDHSRYKPLRSDAIKEIKISLNVPETSPVIVFVGSLGPKYCVEEMLTFFQILRNINKSSVFLFLSNSLDYINTIKDDQLKDGVRFISVSPSEVPKFIAIADLGLTLIRPSESMKCASAVKTGEYLLCGTPVLSTDGIGDVKNTLTTNVGFLIDNPSDYNQLSDAAHWLIDKVIPNRAAFRAACREIGLNEFSLSVAKSSYLTAFDHFRNQ